MGKLNLRNVTLAYGDQVVLNSISFEVRAGELLGMVGPNGCGKSTLIKGLTKVMALRSGHICIDDKDIRTISQRQLARLIAVVPQDHTLPEAFTSFEVVLMGRTPHLGFLEFEGQDDINIAVRAMERTGTRHLSERRVGELSGGERQRLTIARALTQQPAVIVLDEPTSHLDINYQIETLELISNLCKEEGLIVLAAMHDLNLAAQYCNRVIMLSNGGIHAEGCPSEVITAENIKEAYRADVCVSVHPINHLPVTLITAGGTRCGSNPKTPDGGSKCHQSNRR